MNFSETPITLLLIAANVIFSMIGFSNKDFEGKMILWPYGIKRRQQYYRMITSGFLHADWMHLIFNMFTFFFFGSSLEVLLNYYQLGGTIAYLAIYFGALIVSDLPSYFSHQDDPNYRALGASGAVSAVVFAAIVFDPWSSIYLYGALKLSALAYAILFIVYCVYMDKRGGDNVNHNAHLWGSIFGLGSIFLLIAIIQPELFGAIVEKLKHPSLFGTG